MLLYFLSQYNNEMNYFIYSVYKSKKKMAQIKWKYICNGIIVYEVVFLFLLERLRIEFIH